MYEPTAEYESIMTGVITDASMAEIHVEIEAHLANEARVNTGRWARAIGVPLEEWVQ